MLDRVKDSFTTVFRKTFGSPDGGTDGSQPSATDEREALDALSSPARSASKRPSSSLADPRETPAWKKARSSPGTRSSSRQVPQPILIPTDTDEVIQRYTEQQRGRAREHGVKERMSQYDMSRKKPGSGGFKPQNSLGRSSNAAMGSSSNARHRMPAQPFTTSVPPPRKTLTTYANSGANVRRSQNTRGSAGGDGFWHDDEDATRPTKRQRTDTSTPHYTRTIETVNLSDDEDEPPNGTDLPIMVEPMKRSSIGNVRQEARRSSGSVQELGPRSGSNTRNLNYFGTQEMRSVETYTAVSKPKLTRCRKSQDSQHTSGQSSASRDTPNAGSASRKGSWQSNIRPAERDQLEVLGASPTGTAHSPYSTVRRSPARTAGVVVVPVSNGSHRSAEAGAKSERLAELPKNTTKSSPMKDNGLLVPSPANTRQRSPFLRTKFLRYGSSPSPESTHSSARQRMKLSSGKGERVSPIDDDLDELQGGNTVQGKAAKSGLAQKNIAAISNAVLKGPGRRRDSSDNIKPTIFKTSKTEEAQQPKKEETIKYDTDDGVRIPIQGVFSRGCVLSSAKGDLELVWDVDIKAFKIEYQGQMQRLPWKGGTLATIGPRECATFVSAVASTKIILRGSITDNSYGQMVVHVVDKGCKSELYNQLLAASKDHLTTKQESAEKIEQIFYRLVHDIQLDQKKYIKTHDSHRQLADQELALMKKRQGTDWSDALQTTNLLRSNGNKRSSNMLGDERVQPVQHSISTRNRPSTDGEISKYYMEEPRRSTRQPKPTRPKTPTPDPIERWSEMNNPTKWPQPVTYPQQGPRRVTVEFVDLPRLDEGEFLNDNLIDFALRQAEERMMPKHREQVHFFSTFFYTALTEGKKNTINYDKVKRWTKNKDLFNIPFVIVPIHHDMHWLVAIVCNLPNVERRLAGDDNDDIVDTAEVQDTEQPLSSKAQSPVANESVIEVLDSQEQDALRRNEVEQMDGLSLEEREATSFSPSGSGVYTFDDNGQARDVSAQPDSKAPAKPVGGRRPKRKAPPPRKLDPTKPTIITLDSLGAIRRVEVANIKKYLSAEALEKRGMELDASDRKNLQGMTAKGIPEQTNFCDCGVFVVGYVEEFSKDPRGFVNKLLAREAAGNDFMMGFDPNEKRAQIRDELLGLVKKAEEEKAAKKEAKKASTKDVKVPAAVTVTSTTPSSPGKADGARLKDAEAQTTAKPPPATSITAPQSKSVSEVNGTSTEERQAALQDQEAGATSQAKVAEEEIADALPTIEQPDSDQLEVEVPRALPGTSPNVAPSKALEARLSPQPEIASSEPDENEDEMLLDKYESEAIRPFMADGSDVPSSSMAALGGGDTHADIFKHGLPSAHRPIAAPLTAQSRRSPLAVTPTGPGLLDDLKMDIKSQNATDEQSRAARHGASGSALRREQGMDSPTGGTISRRQRRQKSPVVAVGRPPSNGRHLKFSD